MGEGEVEEEGEISIGRDSNFACKDCKKNYHLGYGTYTTWLDYVKTASEYDALSNDKKHLAKNINYRKCLSEHEGHDYVTWSNDWCYEDNGNLYVDGGGYMDEYLLCERFSEYEKIDLDT